MQYFRKIVGDRIYLSPRGASDEEIEKFTEWMNDFQVTDYINKSEQIMTAIGEKEWLENTARKNENKNFNIIDLNSNKLNNCMIVNIHQLYRGMLNYDDW